MKLKIYVEQRVWQASTAVWIVGEDASGTRFIAEPMDIKFTKIDRNLGAPQDPSLIFQDQMSSDFFGALHDAIVEAGYKPKDTSLEAMKYHLEDMRKIAMGFTDAVLSDVKWK